MKDTLQLHEIAGYLPYKLHIKHDEGARLIICGAFKKHNRDDFFTYSLLNWTKDVKSTEAKPILRPMSESELTKVLTTSVDDCIMLDYIGTSKKDSQLNARMLLAGKSDQLEQWKFERLLEFHFDVHNLIGRGLAIDINTLKD